MNITISDLIASLKAPHDGANPIILTANQRQSRMLRTDFASTIPSVSLPDILTLNEWVGRLWDNCHLEQIDGFDKRLLTPEQSSWFWKESLKFETSVPALIDAANLSVELQKAEDIEQQYCLELQASAADQTDEAEFYQRVRRHKNTRIHQRNAITVLTAVERLTEHFRTKQSERALYVFGFVEMPPIFEKLVKAVAREFYTLEDVGRNTSVASHASPNMSAELDFAIDWVSKTIEEHPGQSVAIVSPDLHSQHTIIRRKLYRAFEADKYLMNEAPLYDSFDLSVGEVLADIPLVSDSIALLFLFNKHLPREKALQLLMSPYWTRTPVQARSHLTEKVCEYIDNNVSTAWLLSVIKADEPRTPELLSVFSVLVGLRPETKTKRYPSEWSSWFIDLLKLANWPGDKDLSSREYQQLQAFLSSLETLCTFDSIEDAPISFYDFRSLLLDLCLNRGAQIEIKNPKLRVLGLMEAAGQRFDHCLILGLTDTALPQKPKLNPFLPVSLQKQANTPRSSAEREFNYTKDLLFAIKAASMHLILSYHKLEDAEEKRASPLIAMLCDDDMFTSLENNDVKLGVEKIIQEKQQFANFDLIETGNAPALPKGSEVAGGISHLNAHWNNPMFAFFQYRLGIPLPQNSYLGLSPLIRGSLLHLVLQNMYREITNLAKLKAFLESSDSTLKIAEEVSSAWKSFAKLNRNIAPIVESHEKEKMEQCVLQFLKVDAQRAQNFTVIDTEQKNLITLNTFTFSTRIDRVDKLDHGGLLILDYKTGQTSLSGVSKSQTTDFQLPLYAISKLNSDVAAVAFVEINSREARFKGVGDEYVSTPGILSPSKIRMSELPENWNDTVQHWQANAEKLVLDLARGIANYNPRNKAQAPFFSAYEPAVRMEEREIAND